jgi:polypeptide N-acetylgalactosaminyltransferase
MVSERERKRKKDTSEPTLSPTMAGGLFSIDKEFFIKLGLYDDGFDIWGKFFDSIFMNILSFFNRFS